MRKLSAFLLLLILSFGLVATAAENTEGSSDVLLTQQLPASAEDSMLAEEWGPRDKFEIRFDPAGLEDYYVELRDSESAAFMRRISDPENENLIAHLSVQEKRKFLDMRSKALLTVLKMVKMSRVQIDKVLPMLKLIDKELHLSAKPYVPSNKKVLNFSPYIATGIGVPEKLFETLKKSHWGRFLPKRGGFFLLLGLGGGISKTLNPDGSKTFVLTGFITKATFAKSLTGVVDLTAGMNFEMLFTQNTERENHFNSILKVLGLGMKLTRNEKNLGLSYDIGLSAVPVISNFFIHEHNENRWNFMRLEFTRGGNQTFMQRVLNLVRGKVRTCEGALINL